MCFWFYENRVTHIAGETPGPDVAWSKQLHTCCEVISRRQWSVPRMVETTRRYCRSRFQHRHISGPWWSTYPVCILPTSARGVFTGIIIHTHTGIRAVIRTANGSTSSIGKAESIRKVLAIATDLYYNHYIMHIRRVFLNTFVYRYALQRRHTSQAHRKYICSSANGRGGQDLHLPRDGSKSTWRPGTKQLGKYNPCVLINVITTLRSDS